MKTEEIFTSDFKTEPYWWEGAPLSPDDQETPPDKCDVLIIGAGYTGLQAAIQTSQAGMNTVVIDAENLGFGCSTRNGGQISTCIKPTYFSLEKKYGDKLARAIRAEGEASLKFVSEFVKSNKIDCDLSISGRFHGAYTPRHYERLARECDATDREFLSGAYAVPKSEQHLELGTDRYYGGIVFPHNANLHPAKYHSGLLAFAKSLGTQAIGFCRATDITRNATDFSIKTTKGPIAAKKVLIATNGYTADLVPHLQKRIIPIGSYIIATEEIPKAVMDRLFPTGRTITDSRKLVFYYRPSPDRQHI
ncbi:MAG: NAD(P)/FAD-dependent oxidoreductase, partial [Rhizobiaceae bacterium]